MTRDNELIKTWRETGPVKWAEGPGGWIDIDGQPIKLTLWQRAALTAYFEHRTDVSTFAISNVKKTGKTFLNGVLLAWRWLCLPGTHFAIGNDLDQSQARQFAMISEMVRRNPYLSETVKAGKSELLFIPTGSTLTALAGDAAGNAGSNHLTASHTEAWGIIYEAGIRAFEEMTPPPGKFYGLPSLRITDSYAGFVGESKTWHKLVDRGLAGERLAGVWPIFKAGGLLLFHMEGEEAQERCYRGTDMERLEYYAEQSETLRPNAYQRMHFNRRTSGESAFVTAEQWQACYSPEVRPLGPGEDIELILGADASTTHDYTALIGLQNGEAGADVRLIKVWKPKTIVGMRFGKPSIDLEQTIGAEVLALHKERKVKAIVYDPWQLATVARQWEKAGIKCIEMPQTAQRVEADTALFNAIISGRVRHYKNAELDEAIGNAIIIETPRGIRIAKEKASRKIDALVALSMAHHAAITQKVYGAMVAMPNFIYGEADTNDYIFLGDNIIYAPKHTNKPHGPGVTWRTCRRRMDGCEACIAELEAEGEFTRQNEAAALGLARGAGIPMSEEEYIEEMKIRRGTPLREMEMQHEQKIISKFWQAVRANHK
jgi:hypothetical protein